MSSTTAHGPAPDSSHGVRPLPPRPNLEFERKQAKKLLGQLRRGDPEALKRVRAQRAGPSSPPGDFKLADAQFAIAREYGFLSWPRLVGYFTILERHERSGPWSEAFPPDFYEGRVRSILAEHRDRRAGVGHFLASFVPRFYGLSVAEVFDSEVTVEDARIVVARENMCASWEALLEQAEQRPRHGWEHYASPGVKAHKAVQEGDLAALSELIDAHPELLRATGGGDPPGRRLLYDALVYERRTRSPQAKQTTDWLIARGVDPTETLNRMLLGYFHMTMDDVTFHLERGADPTWMPPNGITVLEHAIFRYWNGDAVDLIARRVAPRKAFWIAAGLGDVKSLGRYLDRKGRPNDAARRQRPDFTAIGPAAMPSLPDAGDVEVLWEAFLVAGLNHRVAVLDMLLDTGFPIDYAGLGSTLLHFAVGNRLVPLVEYLVSRGANLDLKGWRPSTSARESAEWHYQNDPSNPDTRRILELCGGRDPETVIRGFEEQRAKSITLAPKLLDTVKRAREEAARLHQAAVQPDNLFVAMLRDESSFSLAILSHAGVDVGLLRRTIEHRLVPGDDSPRELDIPHSAEAQAALEAARAEAEARRRSVVTTLHLLWSLAGSETGPVADILTASGSTPKQVRDECASSL